MAAPEGWVAGRAATYVDSGFGIQFPPRPYAICRYASVQNRNFFPKVTAKGLEGRIRDLCTRALNALDNEDCLELPKPKGRAPHEQAQHMRTLAF